MKLTRILAVVVMPVVLFGGIAGGAVTANASTPATSQASRTCTAFAAWERHPTTGAIDAMISDTLGGSWSGDVKYIVGDAASLYGDVRSDAKAKYVASDVKYMKSDCAEDA